MGRMKLPLRNLNSWELIFLGIFCFSLVYLGEHYVIDILAGILYASVVFWFSLFWLKKQSADLTFSAEKIE